MTLSRFLPRRRRQLQLSLHDQQPCVTAEVTAGGFVASMVGVAHPGQTVRGTIALGAECFPFTGEVTWAKRSDPRLSLQSRFGVRFTSVANEFFELLREPSR